MFWEKIISKAIMFWLAFYLSLVFFHYLPKIQEKREEKKIRKKKNTKSCSGEKIISKQLVGILPLIGIFALFTKNTGKKYFKNQHKIMFSGQNYIKAIMFWWAFYLLLAFYHYLSKIQEKNIKNPPKKVTASAP